MNIFIEKLNFWPSDLHHSSDRLILLNYKEE